MKQNFRTAFFLIFLILFSALPLISETFKISVATNGGSGKAHVLSPAELTLLDGKASIKIVWSSENFDYMILNGKKYLNENAGGKSTFTLAVALSSAQIKNLQSANFGKVSFSLKVLASTTAMSRPHEIEYELKFNDLSAQKKSSSKDFSRENSSRQFDLEAKNHISKNLLEKSSSILQEDFSSLKKCGSLNLLYAKEFSVDFYESCKTDDKLKENKTELPPQDYKNQFALITISSGEKFLLVPQNEKIPQNLPEKTAALKMPLNKTYLVSTSAMDYVVKNGAIDFIRFSGTKAGGWFIQEAKDAMKQKKLLYAGKYSAPDYELLVSLGCNFAIENTMIYHNPEVKEKLEELGIPVFVERSGYESDPLGRLEWIKLYGLLFGKLDEAEKYFESALKKIQPVLSKNAVFKTRALQDNESSDGENQKNLKSAAFFFVNSNGAVNVRKSGDYISKMIEIAGAKYIFQDDKKNDDKKNDDEKKHVSTQTVQFESFYAAARNADILIYDGTIDGGIQKKSDLLKKNPLFADFKAYRAGNIYCVGKDFFQRSTGTADFITDVGKTVSDGESGESGFAFLRKVK